MKRHALIKHLKGQGCLLYREGKKHTIFVNLESQKTTSVPRHQEIDDKLARKICRDLGIAEIGKN